LPGGKSALKGRSQASGQRAKAGARKAVVEVVPNLRVGRSDPKYIVIRNLEA
jgi:hypothetical protein